MKENELLAMKMVHPNYQTFPLNEEMEKDELRLSANGKDYLTIFNKGNTDIITLKESRKTPRVKTIYYMPSFSVGETNIGLVLNRVQTRDSQGTAGLSVRPHGSLMLSNMEFAERRLNRSKGMYLIIEKKETREGPLFIIEGEMESEGDWIEISPFTLQVTI